ncbi:MAG: LysR family transcriptional regulator [Alphaproteobacteria bacterium]|nr:MAG: LysR family transcriptional regulator [Alphaproteobacteria bacterium]
MKRALLPLNALRVFDAAARHLSFKNAADELAVTPAAVSQQIRALEDYLGVVLFKRQARSLELTEDAERALPALREGFERFEEAVRILQASQRSNALTVSVAPSFASKWLVPRIERFLGTRPDMDVRILASTELVNFAEENVDLAIRYGAGDYEGLHVEKLIDEQVFPVCNPALVEGPDGLKSAGDLARFTLIHDDTSVADPSNPTWTMWLQAAGVDVASRVYVIGYPSRVESNGAGFPIVRSGIIAGYPLFPASEHPVIQIDFHTFEGDSGGPVFIASDESGEHPLLLGLTMGYVRFDEKINSVYEERTVHHPLNLGMIIRATVVRETLDLARNGASTGDSE